MTFYASNLKHIWPLATDFQECCHDVKSNDTLSDVSPGSTCTSHAWTGGKSCWCVLLSGWQIAVSVPAYSHRAEDLATTKSRASLDLARSSGATYIWQSIGRGPDVHGLLMPHLLCFRIRGRRMCVLDVWWLLSVCVQPGGTGKGRGCVQGVQALDAAGQSEGLLELYPHQPPSRFASRSAGDRHEVP
jgi:hypothetical protein